MSGIFFVLVLFANALGVLLLRCVYYPTAWIVMIFNFCSFNTACDKIDTVCRRFF